MTGKVLHLGEEDDVEVLRRQLTDSRRSAETVSQYVNCLCVLHRKLGSLVPVHRVDLWAKVPSCMPCLQKLKLSSAKSQVAVILVALRKWPRGREAWTPLWCQLCQRLEARQRKGLMTSRERTNWVSSAELHQKLGELGALCAAMKHAVTCSQRRTVLSWTVLSILVKMPAVRTGNLSDVRVVASLEDAGSTENVLVKGSRGYELVLRKFKTSWSCGEQVITFPDQLSAVMDRSLKIFPRKYLVCLLRYPDRGMSSNMVSQLCAKIFPDKNVTPSLLRKIWVSSVYRTNPTLEQKCCLASKMMHSVDVAGRFYAKQLKGPEASRLQSAVR